MSEIVLTETELQQLSTLNNQVVQGKAQIGEIVLQALAVAQQVSGVQGKLQQVIADKVALAGIDGAQSVSIDWESGKVVVNLPEAPLKD